MKIFIAIRKPSVLGYFEPQCIPDLIEILNILDALRDLPPFVQFKKREKQAWRSDTFSKFSG